jgi:hypothetical protein
MNIALVLAAVLQIVVSLVVLVGVARFLWEELRS